MTLAAATAEQVSVLTSVNSAAGQCMLGKLSDRFCSIHLASHVPYEDSASLTLQKEVKQVISFRSCNGRVAESSQAM